MTRLKQSVWGVEPVGGGRVNEGDDDEGIWFMEFIYLHLI
jgi:hypothetical protein